MKLLLIAGLLALAFPFYRHESVRWRHCYSDCEEAHAAHYKLLQSHVCQNARDRLAFKLMGTVDCEKATKATRLSLSECATHEWRRTSEVVRVYHLLFDAYWKWLLWILPALFYWLYLKAQTHREISMFDRHMSTMQKTLGHLLPHKSSNNKRKMIEASPLQHQSIQNHHQQQKQFISALNNKKWAYYETYSSDDEDSSSLD